MSHATAPIVTTAGERHRGITLALIVACNLMVPVTIAAVNISLPAIRADMRLSIADLSWVSNAYLLAFGGLLLLGGRAGDILGRRRMFAAGIALFVAASLFGAFATSAAWLVVALVGAGVGAAFAEPASLALIAANFPEGQVRNRALGVFAMAAGFGLVIGLTLGGLLSTVSWRWALVVNVPIGLAILALTPFFIAESERTPGRFDAVGALCLTIGTAGLVYGLVRASAGSWGDPVTLVALAGALVLLALAVVAELRASQPVLPLRLLLDRSRGGAYLDTLLIGTLGATLLFCSTLFLQVVLKLSPIQTGLAFLPLALALLAGATVTPRLLTRLPGRSVLVAGIVMAGAGTLWLATLGPGSAYAASVIGPLILIGAGQGTTNTTLNVTILSRVPRTDAGAASGIQQTMLRLGASLGLAGTVTVFGLATGGANRQKAPPDVLVHGIASAFLLSTALLVCALVVALVLFRQAPRPDDA